MYESAILILEEKFKSINGAKMLGAVKSWGEIHPDRLYDLIDTIDRLISSHDTQEQFWDLQETPVDGLTKTYHWQLTRHLRQSILNAKGNDTAIHITDDSTQEMTKDTRQSVYYIGGYLLKRLQRLKNPAL